MMLGTWKRADQGVDAEVCIQQPYNVDPWGNPFVEMEGVEMHSHILYTPPRADTPEQVVFVL